jgi:hypothetical protein
MSSVVRLLYVEGFGFRGIGYRIGGYRVERLGWRGLQDKKTQILNLK